ncbi:MAG: carboxypeptidase-like regulatory domain-containing protein [Gemmatimonadota bacterium]|nr:MAG: carboxypeptidase-like regulatory domain-containing protein [Gemmatimonadota bacterium]
MAKMPATLLLALALSGFFLSLRAQEIEEAKLCRVIGTIVDDSSGAPLPNTVVTIPELGRRWVSNSAGIFVIDSISLGTYLIYIRRVGYEATDGTLTVERTGSLEVGLRRQLPDFSSRGHVSGTVIDRSTRQPIAGAVVNVLQASRQVLTDEQGHFAIQELPVGVLSLSVEMLGYARRREPISVQTAHTTSLEIALAVEPIELEPIVVEVRSQYLDRVGFYQRVRSEPGGWHYTAEEIDRLGTFYLSDVLRRVPGVRVYWGFDGVRVRGRGGPRCWMRIYLDGFRMAQYWDLDMIDPSTVGGLEVYHGLATPIQYGHRSTCGVILIWSRR